MVKKGSEDGMANEAGRTDFMYKDQPCCFSLNFYCAGFLRITQGYLSGLESVAARR